MGEYGGDRKSEKAIKPDISLGPEHGPSRACTSPSREPTGINASIAPAVLQLLVRLTTCVLPRLFRRLGNTQRTAQRPGQKRHCHGSAHCGLARTQEWPGILSSMLKPQNQRYARLTLTSRTRWRLAMASVASTWPPNARPASRARSCCRHRRPPKARPACRCGHRPAGRGRGRPR